jgi:thioredoxin reductase (NADPH)
VLYDVGDREVPFVVVTAGQIQLARPSGAGDVQITELGPEDNPVIELHTHTEIVALEGPDRLEGVRWRDNISGIDETRDIKHVFLMTGAVPNTQWLERCVALDPKKFVKTGPDLSHDDLAAARWPLTRAPYVLETSLPGVFAVGDVRSGNVKRVASAVGEGSIAIASVHQVLQQ